LLIQRTGGRSSLQVSNPSQVVQGQAMQGTTSPLGGSTLRERLEEFYRRHSPEGVSRKDTTELTTAQRIDKVRVWECGSVRV
jgi:hypothetical protein